CGGHCRGIYCYHLDAW
nr:immunoglobulin heavy chain junction region [Macaca mulatta]MOW33326.1 immunoglobulin heavy chain junction region [Macaca mulatta]